MVFDHHHFHFFGGKEINSLYVTIGLLHFATGLMGFFVPIYFWKLGFPFWNILFFYLLHSLYFMLFTFVLLPAIRKLSDKMMMFLSIPFLILYYLGLGFITDFPLFFYILPMAQAIGAILFNIGYHIDFSGSVDDKQMGREVGTRFMIGAVAQFASPFIGGILIGFLGFKSTFVVGSAILLFAVLPLFFFPKRNLSPNLHFRPILNYLTNKHILPFNISGMGYATEAMIGRIVWAIFIFLTVGSIQNFGGVISLGLLASIIAMYLAGFLSDVGKRRKVISIATSLLSFVWILRLLFPGVGVVVGSQVAGKAIHSSFMVAWSSQYYKIARAVSDPSLFILSREVLYNIARIIFIPILMLLSVVFSTSTFFTISFLIAAVLSLLFLFANKQHRRDLHDGFLAQ